VVLEWCTSPAYTGWHTDALGRRVRYRAL